MERHTWLLVPMPWRHRNFILGGQGSEDFWRDGVSGIDRNQAVRARTFDQGSCPGDEFLFIGFMSQCLAAGVGERTAQQLVILQRQP